MSTDRKESVPVMRRPGPVLRWFLRLPMWLYRARLGWIFGHRFVCLTHRGRRSGRTYRTVVEVVHFDRSRDESVVMSGFGRRSDWFKNVEAGGALRVQTGRGRYRPQWRELDVEEGARVLADYERRNRLIAPIVRRVLGRLVGWRYDGTDEARRRIAGQLPLVAFRPAPGGDGTTADNQRR